MNPPTAAAEPTTIHPLEPLTADEIAAAAGILRDELGLDERARFVFIMLHEPPKDAIHSWTPDASVPREAEVIVRERGRMGVLEAIVSLMEGKVVRSERRQDVQAPISEEEFMAAEEIVLQDPRWQEAMRKRGVEDFSLAMLDPWAASFTVDEDHPSKRRICRPLTWVRSEPGEHGYARPVEGLIATVDLDAMEVIDVIDHGVVPLPPKAGNYVPELMMREGNVPAFDRLRDDVKPIEITQPEGPSFSIEGHEVRWQKWRLRIGFNGKEGLTLHEVGYEDRGKLRPIMHRASLSEMFVPYGDPAPTHLHKNVFDMGEYGIGWLANSLTLGCDCLGEIHYFDGVVNDQDGNARVIENAICMHEEDTGIAWKHTDFRTEEVEVRRARRLVISMIATVGNYEYGYFWYLNTDGTIEYEVKLTGVISTGALPEGERPKHGVLVAPGLYGPHHQHFFCVRMDMEVDGERNSVVEVDSEPMPEGPSFSIEGHEVRWQKWRLRIGFNAKEGLTLHEVGYEDRGKLRPILHRASLSEMFVPYGDPAPTHLHKNVFDMGEYGIGWLANSLTLGCDCLGEIHYFDGVVNDQDGNPRMIENAICMHEEDTGISWKHTDFRTEEVEVRRARRLVISSIATVGNYEYGYAWHFHQDASFEFEAKLTGIVHTAGWPFA
ncbi:MAG TPA: primary-amine oxidase, partial [Gaiellaceae bacterium]|nr:primary-amine oxidase [Gaiellaceae bacterium]